MEMQKHNVRQISLYSNATPLSRHTDLGYGCAFCPEYYQKPYDLKKHTLDYHDTNTRATYMSKPRFGSGSYVVKLDVTNLKCTLCEQVIEYVDVKEHLEGHGKSIHHLSNSYIIPFKFDDDILKCMFCNEVFRSFKTLQMHMNEHYKNYECPVCGVGFINQLMVKTHYKNSHKVGNFACSCGELFDTINKKKLHELHAHNKHKYKCGYCDQFFKSSDTKQIHLTSVHNINFPSSSFSIQCNQCDKQFTKQSHLAIHVKKDHNKETRFSCSDCKKAFFYKSQLDLHMIKHLQTKKIKCEICSKDFARIKALKEHVKIHVGVFEYRCKHCEASFVQKASLKKHLIRKHNAMFD